MDNMIGTNQTGVAAIGNGVGVSVFRSHDHLIGWRSAEAGNLISGFGPLVNGSNHGVGMRLSATSAGNILPIQPHCRSCERSVPAIFCKALRSNGRKPCAPVSSARRQLLWAAQSTRASPQSVIRSSAH